MKLSELFEGLFESSNNLTIFNDFKNIKQYDPELEDDVIIKTPIKSFKYSDDIGGKAYGHIENNIVNIVGMDSIPPEFKYSQDSEKYKRRGFFKLLLKELYLHGYKTIHISLQSSDTRKAVQALLASKILINPRNMGGITVDEHPLTFDISPNILNINN